jgi:methionine-rich copper-binding protein CopC
MQKRIWTAGLAVLVSGAWAHAHLEKAQPAADSKVAEVHEIRLAFSEPIEPKLSTIKLESREDRAVVEPAAELDAADPKVLVVHLFEKLPPGAYTVRWAAVAADGHRMSGNYTFVASP